MRYYVYVSASKVDLLAAQIPDKALSRIAATLTIDLKLVKAELAGKERERTLYSQLELVERYLEEEDIVGTVDEPRHYFRGQMPLRWGPYGNWADETEFVYFGGETDRTILGLGGSMTNVIGQGGSSHAHSHSATPFLVDGLRRELRSRSLAPDTGMDDFRVAQCVELSTTQMSGEPETMEFLAKRLSVAEDQVVSHIRRRRGEPPVRRDILLGTPLFVALSD